MKDREYYNDWINFYGPYPLIIVLDFLEDKELFEECSKIMDVLRKFKNRVGSKDIPTKNGPETLEYFRVEIEEKHGYSGDTYIRNSLIYAQDILDQLGFEHTEVKVVKKDKN